MNAVANKLPKEQMNELMRLRHSCAHILAAAVLRLWPDALLDIGPPTEEGFYYDFDLKHRFTPEDFPKIEEEMRKITKENQVFEKSIQTRAEKIDGGWRIHGQKIWTSRALYSDLMILLARTTPLDNNLPTIATLTVEHASCDEVQASFLPDWNNKTGGRATIGGVFRLTAHRS